MKIEQKNWTTDNGWATTQTAALNGERKLVFAFGNRFQLADQKRYEEISNFYPNSDIILNSTSGEIIGTQVQDDSIVTTAIAFDKTNYKISQVKSAEFDNSYEAGKYLANSFDKENLRHIFVISDGQSVNGSELVKGFNEHLPSEVTTTGGLAGDGARFEKTLVGYNAAPSEGNIVAIGFYGNDLKIGYGSVGGWDSFGAKRTVTKSQGNVLYEIDGKSALSLYKKYLGDKAKGLPSSALLFPLSMQLEENAKPLVRTILSIDEENESMTFAGDIPEGASVQLMKANFDKLIEGASDAANSGRISLKDAQPELALLVSCVGRKIVLDQLIEEEVEGVAEVIGGATAITGFYSYGEIAPFAGLLNCELHNQTMTVTLLSEY